LYNPDDVSVSMRAMSWPRGQAALQGAVFSSYLGWKKRHDPVLLTAVDV
jgi:hypothetical protein